MKELKSKKRRSAVHERWIKQLERDPPIGIAADKDEERRGRYWPVTEGPHGEYQQCLDCRYYAILHGMMGLDWGVCCNEESQYDRKAVFEHWTCKEFVWGGQE